MTEAKQITETLQSAVANAWFALACIDPADLDTNPTSKAAFLQAREGLNVVARLTGFPAGMEKLDVNDLEGAGRVKG